MGRCAAPMLAPLDAARPVAVVWTSGTTGRPKGAVFDHANLAAVARGTDVLSQPGDRRLSPLPFAHVAYMTRAWDEMAHGVTTVITPTPWRADDAIRIMAEERVTVGQGVPDPVGPDARQRRTRAAPNWARCASSAPVRRARPAAMVAEMRQRFGVPVVVRYTSTEASLGTGTTLDVERRGGGDDGGTPGARRRTGHRRRRGCGAARRATVGRVLLRSDAVMRGYWGQGPGAGRTVAELIDADATAAVLARRRMADDG